MNRLKKLFSKSQFISNVTKLLSANLLVQIIAFLLATIITRLYSNDDFGLLAKFMSVAGIFIIIASARFEYAIILPKKDNEAYQIVSFGLLLSLVVSFLSFLFIYFFNNQLNNYFGIEVVQKWIFLMPAVVFFTSSFNLLNNLKNREKNYNSMALGQALVGVSNPLSSIGIHKILNFGLIFSIFISNFIGTIYLVFSFLKNKLFSLDFKLSTLLKKYYQFPTFNLVHALVNNISSNLPVFMLSVVFENYMIGLFTMALGKVFKPINLFSNSIYQVLSKKMVDDLHLKKNVSHHFIKILAILFCIGIGPFTILYFNAEEIFSFVFGAQWFQAGTYLKLLLPWLFMVYLTSSFTFIPNVLKKQMSALVIEIIHLLLRFFALSLGISKLSLESALWNYSLVGVFMMLVSLLWYYYLLKNVNKIDY